MLSPLLFSLYTNDCTSGDPSVKLLKFADDTVIGLIRDGDETAYRQIVWCGPNNLELNPLKTVEMTVDFRRKNPSAITYISYSITPCLLWTPSGSWDPPSHGT